MCALIILRQPDHDWPLINATNRDEKKDRPSQPPGRPWPDRGYVTAARDLLAGGSWLGVNDYGLVAGIPNGSSALRPEPNLRSRGELTLEALDHAEAKVVAKAFLEFILMPTGHLIYSSGMQLTPFAYHHRTNQVN